MALQREHFPKGAARAPWRGPRGATPALPLVCGLGAVVPADALGGYVELPQRRRFGPGAPRARPAGAQDHQDPEARAAWEHGSFAAPARRLHPRTWVGAPQPRIAPGPSVRCPSCCELREAEGGSPPSLRLPQALPPPQPRADPASRAFPGLGLARSLPQVTTGIRERKQASGSSTAGEERQTRRLWQVGGAGGVRHPRKLCPFYLLSRGAVAPHHPP